MVEQPKRFDVVFYCDQCAQHSGRRRILAAAARDNRLPEGRRLWIGRRLPRRPSQSWRQGAPFAHSYSGGAVPDNRTRVMLPSGRFVWVPLHPVASPAAQLICYTCTARPRVARTKLVELAEQAEARGRRDAYA